MYELDFIIGSRTQKQHKNCSYCTIKELSSQIKTLRCHPTRIEKISNYNNYATTCPLIKAKQRKYSPAMSNPVLAVISRIHVGLVTLISVK